jgi:glycosyltransferase involved in cell wall biosynthesis
MVEFAESSPYSKLRHGVVIVSHDAGRAGAPLIALNIARQLVEMRSIPVVTILLDTGELASEFAQMGPMFVARPRRSPEYYLDTRPWARLAKRAIYIEDAAWHDRFWRRISRYLAKRKIRHAVCNSVLSGSAAVRLKEAGAASIGLVHELPHSIRTNKWTDQAAALIRGADSLVFPCPQVEAAFTSAFSVDDKPTHVYPQSFNIDPNRLAVERRTSDRLAFRARQGLSCTDILILGCGGSGDFRKGVDLFVHAARETALSSTTPTRKIVFAWAGHIAESVREWSEKDMAELASSDRLIFLGPQTDMAPCFAAADIFFSSSREDPFPTTVLEAMAYGLPVVGFAGSGGVEEQLRGGVGVIIPYGDVISAVKTLRQLADRPDERNRMARLGREKIALLGGYHAYVGNLIDVLLKLHPVGNCPKDLRQAAIPQ